MTSKKAATKTVKPAVKAKSAAQPSKPAVKSAKSKTPPSHDEIAQLARQYWIEGGHRDGHAEQDWLRAEQKLAGK